jgi:S1-C subfamily serine protease
MRSIATGVRSRSPKPDRLLPAPVVFAGFDIVAPASDGAGVQGGDVIVELAGKTIENIYDYTYVLSAMKVGVLTTLVVQRGAERLTLTVTPGSRE